MNDFKTVEFTDEVELKKFLLKAGFTYDLLGSNDKYVIVYRDGKSGALIYQGIYDSPIVAIRDLNTIVPQVKIPVSDIVIQLVLAYNPSDFKKKPVQFSDIVVLSPYLYFKKPDEIENKEEKLGEKK